MLSLAIQHYMQVKLYVTRQSTVRLNISGQSSPTAFAVATATATAADEGHGTRNKRATELGLTIPLPLSVKTNKRTICSW